MAIVGFLAHAEHDKAVHIESTLKSYQGITTYGIHNEDYVVAVAEVESNKLEEVFTKIHLIDGVLATYVTSLTTEDEEEEYK